MAVESSGHPDPARLAAFGRGILNHGEMADVESHLAVCESCCRALSTLPDDDFVGSLRSALNHLDQDTGPRCAAEPSPTQSEIAGASDLETSSSGAPPGSHSSTELGQTLSPGNLDNPETTERQPELELPAELAAHPRYRVVKRLGSG